MASPIEMARKREATLLAELKQIQQFIQMYEAFSTGLETKLEQTGVAQNATNSSDAALHRNRDGRMFARGPRTGPTPKEIVEMVERMIREAGRPLTRGDIAEMLEARDVELPAADKPRYVGTIMWRNKSKFLNVEGRGYWLRAEPLPRPRADQTDLDLVEEHQSISQQLDSIHADLLKEDKPRISEAAYDKLLERKKFIEDKLPEFF